MSRKALWGRLTRSASKNFFEGAAASFVLEHRRWIRGTGLVQRVERPHGWIACLADADSSEAYAPSLTDGRAEDFRSRGSRRGLERARVRDWHPSGSRCTRGLVHNPPSQSQRLTVTSASRTVCSSAGSSIQARHT